MENVIASKEVQVERKHLSIEFRENERGRFLRITETAHGRRNAVIIPSTGLADFTSALAAVLNLANKPTPGLAPAPAPSVGRSISAHLFSSQSTNQSHTCLPNPPVSPLPAACPFPPTAHRTARNPPRKSRRQEPHAKPRRPRRPSTSISSAPQRPTATAP